MVLLAPTPLVTSSAQHGSDSAGGATPKSASFLNVKRGRSYKTIKSCFFCKVEAMAMT